MDILVDFDNVDWQSRKNGLRALCTRIMQALANKVEMPERCRVRLYGGWFQEQRLTRAALDLGLEIDRFPHVIRWSGRSKTGECIVGAELATSLAVEPTRTLTHTFRIRRFEDNVQVQSKLVNKCPKNPCGILPVEAFFKGKKCITPGCWMTPGDLLEKDEQKLIDTMLTADLIYFATHGRLDLAMVSSDDDLWPGIQMALLAGARVTHLHTHNNFRTRTQYSSGLKEYRETSL